VIRPGGLTDEPGKRLVRIEETPFRGRVPRDDVAAVLEAVLHEPRAARRVLYLSEGEDPVDRALAAALV
jgi:hypothetical protein